MTEFANFTWPSQPVLGVKMKAEKAKKGLKAVENG